MGVVSLSHVVFKNVLTWLEKLLSMPGDRYPSVCFRRLRQLNNTDSKYNWSVQVGELFNSIGCSAIWESITAVSLKREKNSLIRAFKIKLYNDDRHRLALSSYTPFAGSLSVEVGPQPYLKFKAPASLIRLVAQLRLSGKRRIKLCFNGCCYTIDSEVICTVCNLQAPETLDHLIFSCPIYNPVRPAWVRQASDMSGLIRLLNNLTISSMKSVAYLLVNILRTRAFVLNE